MTDPYDWPPEPPVGSVRYDEDGVRWERRAVDPIVEPYSWYEPGGDCLPWHKLARRNPSAIPPTDRSSE